MHSKCETLWEGSGHFFDGVSAKAQPIPLKIKQYRATQKSFVHTAINDETVTLTPQSLRILDRCGDDYVNLTSPQFATGSIVLEDRKTIRKFVDFGLINADILSKSATPIRIVGLIGVLLVLGFLAYRYVANPFAQIAVRLIPHGMEVKIGDASYTSLTQNSSVVSDHEVVQLLEKSASFLEDSLDSSKIDFRITLVNNDEIKNAFALPGGHIVVYSGLLNELETESEWVALLCHEAGHVVYQHGLRRLLKSTVLRYVGILIAGDINGSTSTLVDSSQLLLTLSYSREQEREADAYALSMLKNLGYSTQGLVSLFEKIDHHHETYDFDFLSTHPSIKERIQRIDASIEPASRLHQIYSNEEWKSLTHRNYTE